MFSYSHFVFFFFFNDTATTEIYTLSLHDALPILSGIKEMFWNDEIKVSEKQIKDKIIFDYISFKAMRKVKILTS